MDSVGVWGRSRHACIYFMLIRPQKYVLSSAREAYTEQKLLRIVLCRPKKNRNCTGPTPSKRPKTSSSAYRLHVLRNTVALHPLFLRRCLPGAATCPTWRGRCRRRTTFTCRVADDLARAIACCDGRRVIAWSHAIPEKKPLHDVLRQGLQTVRNPPRHPIVSTCRPPPPSCSGVRFGVFWGGRGKNKKSKPSV